MGRAVRAVLRDGIERSRKLRVGQSQSKRFRKNIAILALIGECSPLDLAGGVAYVQPCIEQRNPGPGRAAIRLRR
jgi:hypothetical protein